MLAHFRDQCRTAIGRKVEARYNKIDVLIESADGFVESGRFEDAVTRHVEATADEPARERRGFGDKDALARGQGGGALEPVFSSRLNDLAEIEEIRNIFADYSGTKKASTAGFLADGNGFFGNVENLIDDHADTAIAIFENDYLDGVCRLVRVGSVGFQNVLERNEREDAITILDNLATAGKFDRVAGELFERGRYPGAQASVRKGKWIHGEMYELPGPECNLRVLDRIEGFKPRAPLRGEFAREITNVAMESRETRRAWIYWLNRAVPRRQSIVSGDYL